MLWLRDEGRLRAFLAVADSGSFTLASKALGQSQPTLSSLVAALEQRVGTPLLVRSRRGCVLTPAGEALKAHAVEVLALAERASLAVRAAVEGGRHLRLAGGEVLMTYVLPPALSQVARAEPGLSADFLVGDETEVLEALRRHRVDAALLTEQASAADLESHFFASDRLVCLVPRGHRLAGSRRVSLAALEQETLVVRHAGAVDRRAAEALLLEEQVEPAHRLVADTFEAVKRCVAAGLGVALAPRMAVGGDPTLVALPVRGSPLLRYCLVRRPGDLQEGFFSLLAALRRGEGRDQGGSEAGSATGIQPGSQAGSAAGIQPGPG